MLDQLVIFVPFILSFFTNMKCPMVANAGSSINARPPKYVFGVVWTTLYFMVGLSWYMTRISDPNRFLNIKVSDWLFIINQISINLWLYYYNCRDDKKSALYTYLPAIATTFALLFYNLLYQKTWWTFMLLIPYLVWLLFAQQLSFHEVNFLEKSFNKKQTQA